MHTLPDVCVNGRLLASLRISISFTESFNISLFLFSGRLRLESWSGVPWMANKSYLTFPVLKTGKRESFIHGLTTGVGNIFLNVSNDINSEVRAKSISGVLVMSS